MARNEESEAVQAFRRYAEAFQTLDPRSVVRYFNEPALMITPQRVQVLDSAAAVEQAYRPVMAELQAKGFARTEFSPLVERRLGGDLAIVSCTGTWKSALGQDLARFGMTYTLRRVVDKWRLVVLTIHPPEADR